jgi:hypothetical protein
LNSDKFNFGTITPDQAVYPTSLAYYFLLTIGTPSRYDYDISDEDNNTGYWSDSKSSGHFSGLYLAIKWKNKFSNGIFTTEISAAKENAVPLEWIRPAQPGEISVDDRVTSEQADEFATQSALVRESAFTNLGGGG